jgi:hypothetical protein
LYSYELARALDRERQAEIERRLRHRFELPPPPPRRSLRQAIGRLLIRIGSALDAEGATRVGLIRSTDLPEIRL